MTFNFGSKVNNSFYGCDEENVRWDSPFIKGEIVGDANLVSQVFGIKEAQEGDITFAANQKYFPYCSNKGSAIITPKDMKVVGKSVILTDNPSLAFANVISLYGGNIKPAQNS